MIDGTDMQLVRTFLLMTREEFADRIGCSATLIYLTESGKRQISPALRRALRRVIDGEEFRGMEKRLADLKQELEEVA